MSLLDRLERSLGRYAIPNLALYLVIGQVFVLLAFLLGQLDLRALELVPLLVINGEPWRAVTFLFLPPPPGMFGYFFVAFAWYIFYLMGNALEGQWGVFRFNVFLLVGAVLTVAASFLTPLASATNGFIAGTVFLAFARLNPDFEMLLFFILPVRIKWLALLTWVLYGVQFALGGWSTRWQILASVGNFLLFFSRDILLTMRHRRRTMERQTRRIIADAGSKVALEPILKWDFYAAVASADHVLTIQTAERAPWANLLLTLGCRTFS